MKRGRETVLRLKNVLLRDKSEIPQDFKEVILSDVTALMSNYVEKEKSTIAVRIEVLNDGNYEIIVDVKTARLKNMPVTF